MMKWGWFIILGIWGLAGGCRESGLEKALRQSGTHRAELEKVLAYFSQSPADSLKLQAAEFLICHMPGHATYESGQLPENYKKTEGLESHSDLIERMSDAILETHSLRGDSLIRREDIHCLKADFLIRHIQEAFAQKENCPWLEDIEFDTFCEYLLPYRMDPFNLEKAQDTTAYLFQELRTGTIYYDDCRYLVSMVGRLVKDSPMWWEIEHTPDTLLYPLPLGPNEKAQVRWIALCSNGIPAALDFIPVANDLSLPTYWVNLLDPRLQEYHPDPLKGIHAGKVYRKTYISQPLPTAVEYIPPFFEDPFHRDVTDTYLNTCDLTLRVPQPFTTHNAYLCQYDVGKWSPVSFTATKGYRATFRRLGKNCVYLPVSYPEGKMRVHTDPFILSGPQEIIYLTADPDSLQTITCQRMQPYLSNLNHNNGWYTGCRFECSDRLDFREVDTVYTLPHRLYYECEELFPDSSYQKRYWRLITKSGYSCFSELQFLDSNNQFLSGQWIGPDTISAYYLCDNQPSTDKIIHSWIGIDFHRPKSVAKIRYMGQNDKHQICPGHEYELFYWAEGQWQSAGIRQARDFRISFSGVPGKALYRLRDRTTQKEGCIFTWEEEKVRFW